MDRQDCVKCHKCENMLFKVQVNFSDGYVRCMCPICGARIMLAGPKEMWDNNPYDEKTGIL